MKQAIMQGLLIVALGGSGALAQVAPAPPSPAAPAAPAVPATPATPAAPRAPRMPEGMLYAPGSSYLGVDISDITPERSAALKLKEARGVEVTMVDQDAPAGKAGFKEHDVIVSFNGENLESVEQVRRLIRETPPGRTVTLGILRNGQPMTLKAQLGERHQWPGAMPPDHEIRIPRIHIPDIDIPAISVMQYSRRNGVMVENLTPQLGEFFGAKNGQGVLVRSVEKGSAGEAAGLHAGDVIVRVGSEAVAETGDWSRLIRGKSGSVPVVVIRDRREQTLTLTLPEHSPGDSSSLDWNILPGETEENIQRQLQGAEQKIQRAQVKLRRQLELQQQDMERLQQQMKNSLRP